MALHTGEADLREGDYYGSAVNRYARSRGLGRYRLKNLPNPIITPTVACHLPQAAAECRRAAPRLRGVPAATCAAGRFDQ